MKEIMKLLQVITGFNDLCLFTVHPPKKSRSGAHLIARPTALGWSGKRLDTFRGLADDVAAFASHRSVKSLLSFPYPCDTGFSKFRKFRYNLGRRVCWINNDTFAKEPILSLTSDRHLFCQIIDFRNDRSPSLETSLGIIEWVSPGRHLHP